MTQERRRGPENNLSGSRLSGDRSRIQSEPPIDHEGPGRTDVRAPTLCDSCKVPAHVEKLLTFELRLRGKFAGEWTLCQRCWEWRQDRRPVLNPDPLTLPEVGDNVA